MNTTVEHDLTAAQAAELLSECNRVLNHNAALATENARLMAENARLKAEAWRESVEGVFRVATDEEIARLRAEHGRLALAVARREAGLKGCDTPETGPPLLRAKHLTPRQTRMDQRAQMARAQRAATIKI